LLLARIAASRIIKTNPPLSQTWGTRTPRDGFLSAATRRKALGFAHKRFTLRVDNYVLLVIDQFAVMSRRFKPAASVALIMQHLLAAKGDRPGSLFHVRPRAQDVNIETWDAGESGELLS